MVVVAGLHAVGSHTAVERAGDCTAVLKRVVAAVLAADSPAGERTSSWRSYWVSKNMGLAMVHSWPLQALLERPSCCKT